MSSLNYEELDRIFKKLDKNGDGFVSIDDFVLLLENIGVHASLDELELLVGKTSLDLIDFSLFYEIIIINRRDNLGEDQGKEDQHNFETDLAKAFKIFDLNDDGFISCEELHSTLLRLGLWDEHCVGSDCRSMISVFDTNSDGVLDFEEFKNMMMVAN